MSAEEEDARMVRLLMDAAEEEVALRLELCARAPEDATETCAQSSAAQIGWRETSDRTLTASRWVDSFD